MMDLIPPTLRKFWDILKQHQVPATFFIIGINGDLYPKTAPSDV